MAIHTASAFRFHEFAFVILAGHQIADGFLHCVAIFLGVDGFAVGQIGQEGEARVGFAVVMAPGAVGILIDAQPFKSAQHSSFGVFAPLPAILANGGGLTFARAASHVAGRQIFDNQRTDGVGGNFQFGGGIGHRRSRKVGDLRRRGHVNIHFRRSDSLHFGKVFGRLKVFQKVVQFLLVHFDHLDFDFAGLFLGELTGKYEQQHNGNNVQGD